MSRPIRLGIVAATAVIALLALDTLAWWLLTQRLASEVATWQAARVAAGYDVTAGTPARSGWPFRAELVLPLVRIGSGPSGSPNAVAWQSSEARLVYAPWHPTEVTIVLDGPQTLQFGEATPVTLQTLSLDLAVPLDEAGQAEGVVVTARHLHIPLVTGSIGVDSLWLKLGPAAIHVSLSAVTLPGINLPLNATIGSLDLQARSTIPLPNQRDPAVAASAWRDAGGQIMVGDMALGWGPLDVHGTGTFGLDRSLQPAGSGSLRITGYAQAIDAFAHAGIVTRNNAMVATTLLSLVSHTGSDGQPQADLPFTVRDGLLSAGAIPLMKFPPLALP